MNNTNDSRPTRKVPELDLDAIRARVDAAARALAADRHGDAHWETASESYREAWREKARRVIADYSVVAAAVPALQADERAEVERLRAWKAEALSVMSGLQEVGRALDVPLGRQITARATADAALDLRNQLAAARAALAKGDA